MIEGGLGQRGGLEKRCEQREKEAVKEEVWGEGKSASGWEILFLKALPHKEDAWTVWPSDSQRESTRRRTSIFISPHVRAIRTNRPKPATRKFLLGRDMGGVTPGGCKTYGGRKTYQRTRCPENFWTPPKELLLCSVVDFCTGKTEH